MTREEFIELTDNKIIYLDGATGSNLQKRGMPQGVCPEKWILDNPDVLIELQREYVEAGSNIVYAPTFTGNRIKLKEYGLETEINYINSELVKISKRAVGDKAYVAGDITMTGVSLKPTGPLEFEELVEVYKEQISILVTAGCDLLAIETMMSLQETRAALIAAKETCDLPVICTLTFEEDGRTLFGSDAASSVVVLESLGAAAVGANCSTGPDKMLKIIKDMASVSTIPIITKPNAGMPLLDDNGDTVYPLEATEFAEEMISMVEAGAGILGGCCGSTPEHIRKLVLATRDLSVNKRKQRISKRFLSSERKLIAFSLDDPFMVVGERINPTGKKKLQAELIEGSLNMVCDFANDQEKMGADILDINVGMGGIDEKEMMKKVLEEVSIHTSLPLSIDSSVPEVLECALRHYPGRALLNSISLESAWMKEKFRIAKKYGAMVVLLPLSDEGLPKNFEEKLKYLNELVDYALSIGFSKEDLVIDGLVSTVGANPNAAKEVIETIAYCYENGLATTCGLSNVSFGLPQRSFVNSAFLTMLIENHLTMAIMNPSQDLLMNAKFASDLLMNKKDSSIMYINRMNEKDYALSTENKGAVGDKKSEEAADTLYLDVINGNTKGIEAHTREALESGRKADIILNDSLMKAIDKVGTLFNEGKYFLPQLIASAEAMKLSIEILEPIMLKDKSSLEDSPVVVMATVKGDIHDIGKNLVVMMLKNHGFKVIDLGKDVPKEEIIKAAKESNASIIGLSALMTTTMKEMKNVIEYAHSEGVTAKIMLGGAVVTEEYAKEIGADGYSKDAAEAVLVAKKLLG